MKMIVGLGNPGKKYEKTRHNAGFLFVDYLQNQLAEEFSNWKLYKRLEAEISEAKINRVEYSLIKPQTYMNESGRCVSKVAGLNGLKYFEDLIIVHDDIDLPLGKYKIQSNRGTAGHKGVSSIVEHMKTKEFVRIRIGIYPENIDKKNLVTPKFVLQNFSKPELNLLLGEIFPKIIGEILPG